MSKKDIFNYFYTNSTNFNVESILMIMAGGLLISLIIFLTYWVSYKGVSYNRKFNISLVILTLISIVIMLMISSNIVISLGMVGALSIIRFRTPIKDSRDTVYIFWAITEGLCVGSQNFKLSLITTLFIAIIILLTCFIPKLFNKYLIIVRGTNTKIDVADLLREVSTYTVSYKIRTLSKDKESEEVIIEATVKRILNPEIVEKLLKVKGVTSVNYIIETGENVG